MPNKWSHKEDRLLRELVGPFDRGKGLGTFNRESTNIPNGCTKQSIGLKLPVNSQDEAIKTVGSVGQNLITDGARDLGMSVKILR